MWRDRFDAGQELAEKLKKYRGRNTVVYGLPRGGVVVAAQVAKRLNAPLDMVIARKIGHPVQPEYAIAAVAENGEVEMNEIEVAQVEERWFEKAVKRAWSEAKRRRQMYFGRSRPISAKFKTAILVDDGIATGLSLRAAIKQLRDEEPSQIIVASPVAPDDTAAEIAAEVDELVLLHREQNYFGAVGSYYRYFEQVEDDEVKDALAQFA